MIVLYTIPDEDNKEIGRDKLSKSVQI